MRLAGILASRGIRLMLAPLCLLGLLLTPPAPTSPRAPRSDAPHHRQQTHAPTSSQPAPLTVARVREVYGQIELSFEANRGQADASADFVARGAGYAIFLKPTEAVFVLARRAGSATQDAPEQSSDAVTRRARRRRWRARRGAARAAEGSPHEARRGDRRRRRSQGADELEGKVNYLIGNDPAKWRTDVPTYGRVRYGDVYPGVDRGLLRQPATA